MIIIFAVCVCVCSCAVCRTCTVCITFVILETITTNGYVSLVTFVTLVVTVVIGVFVIFFFSFCATFACIPMLCAITLQAIVLMRIEDNAAIFTCFPVTCLAVCVFDFYVYIAMTRTCILSSKVVFRIIVVSNSISLKLNNLNFITFSNPCMLSNCQRRLVCIGLVSATINMAHKCALSMGNENVLSRDKLVEYILYTVVGVVRKLNDIRLEVCTVHITQNLAGVYLRVTKEEY